MPRVLPKWKPEGLRIESAWVGNGVLLYTCNACNSNAPLGSCWVNLTSNSFGHVVCEILDIYTPEKFRRMGVATFILRYLLDAYGMLRTGTETKVGGLALLKAMGWKQNRQTGDWYLRGKTKRISK